MAGAMAPLVFLALVVGAFSTTVSTGLHLNPVRRVVNMLQMMQKKVTAEGETEKELFDKFMCYCQNGEKTLSVSISEAETRIPQLESSLNAGTAEKSQMAADVTQATKDKAEAQKAISEATAIRTKEAANYAKESTEGKASVTAMESALQALRRGTSGTFLQTEGAANLRHLVLSADLPDWDRNTLTAFLSATQKAADSESDADGDAYEPDSGDIIGIISQLKESTSKNLVEAAAAEKKALSEYEALMAARTKEVGALGKEIESKSARLGEVGVELVNLEQDMTDTKKLFAQNTKFLADLSKSCTSKSAEWDERSKTRAEELVAIADTIKLLNDDDAQHLFKKTLPSASLLQVQASSREVMQEASQVLTARPGRGRRDFRLSLITMAMRGKKANFDKVVGMIDKMVVLLNKEQTNDDEKKEYCKDELAKAQDEKASLASSSSDLKKTVANEKELVSSLSEEIAKAVAGIKALDKAVAEATQARKEEHTAYVEELSSNSAAIEILEIAKNRMNKFYNPGQYKAPPKPQLSEEDQIAVNFGATAPSEAPPPSVPAASSGVSALQEAFSFLQLGVSIRHRLRRGPPAPPPATFGAYSKQKAEGGGPISMIDTLIRDVEKQITEMKKQESDAQAEYEQFMADSSEKHAEDAKAVSAKESEKADLEAAIQKHGLELKAVTSEAAANAEYLMGLHKECDWMLKNFDVRKEARADEIFALKKATAILDGADYSFLQQGAVQHRHLRRQSKATFAHKLLPF